MEPSGYWEYKCGTHNKPGREASGTRLETTTKKIGCPSQVWLRQGSGVQGHLQLDGKAKARTVYLKPYLKIKNK